MSIALPCVHAQEDDEDARAGLSRAMRLAIHAYEQGYDAQAMDRFMEILTQGIPSERSMANEYINMITRRMNTGGTGGPAPVPAPAPRGGETVPRTAGPVEQPPPRPAKGGTQGLGEEMSASNKALMRKEIKARLRSAQERSLADLKAIDGLRIAMRDNGDPEAIGIPSALLFQSGISFQRDASRVLAPLTKLVFALGRTQVLLLPEGSIVGDAKVLDMRRTMGITSALFQAGVAPPRVRVNLLHTQVNIPKPLSDFKGIVVVFQYDQALNLTVDNAIGEESGPPISLGVFPPQIRPAQNQGAIIEFSVSDPPAGLVSWKFQLFQPSKSGEELSPLQEVVGGGPVFHQIFWNGRQRYFGDPLPAGRYECVLSALDAKNRTRTLHRWIQLIDEEGEGGKTLATSTAPAAEPAATAAAAPSSDLPGAASKPLLQSVKPAAVVAEVTVPSRPAAKPKRKSVRRAVRARKAAEGGGEDRGAPGRYALSFEKNTHRMTAAGEKVLAEAANNISSYSPETLRIVGHADADEADAAALADRRAKMVAGLLINRYQFEPKKVQVASSPDGGALVELHMTRDDR